MTTEFRVLVCGGRDFTDRDAVFSALDAMKAEHGPLYIIHGNARGADMLAHEWAKQSGSRGIACPANWARDGKGAGHMRNQRMLGHGPKIVLAFPGGRGTADMVSRARKAGIPVMMPLGEPARDRAKEGE